MGGVAAIWRGRAGRDPSSRYIPRQGKSARIHAAFACAPRTSPQRLISGPRRPEVQDWARSMEVQ
eukprot:7129076-Pyramimonas_sp.AAC.1